MNETADSPKDEVISFVEWVDEHKDLVVAAMVTKHGYHNEAGARSSLKDHFDSIAGLGVVMCANRVRSLVKYAAVLPDAPVPCTTSIDWLYESPEGKRAQHIFMYD